MVAGLVSALVYGLTVLFDHTTPSFFLIKILMSLPGFVTILAIEPIAYNTIISAIVYYSINAMFWFLAGVVSAWLTKRNLPALAIWIVIAIGEGTGLGLITLFSLIGTD